MNKIQAVFQWLFDMTRAKAQEVVPTLVGANWVRPSGNGFVELPEDQLRYIHVTAKCPYCKSAYGTYDGPRGGMSVNLFCGNPDCDSRFNVISQDWGFIPLGQFTGCCPADFIAMRRRQIAEEKS